MGACIIDDMEKLFPMRIMKKSYPICLSKKDCCFCMFFSTAPGEILQLIVIHRTIVAYKSRSLAFEEVYGPSHNDTKSQGDLLAFSKKFDSALLPIVTVFNSSRGGGAGAGGSSINSGGSGVVYEWKPTGQSYPYRIPQRHNMNHIWTKGKCPEMSSDLREWSKLVL